VGVPANIAAANTDDKITFFASIAFESPLADAGATTASTLHKLYITGMTFVTGRGHPRMVIPQVLELARSGKIKPARVTSKVVSWDDAIRALLDPPTKVVIAR
jgi:threonine dehydrogenase-like Zn-dependent dehydrogenase